MNHRQIDCFIAVAQCHGFSAAARRLYLSQSTVSQQVISLENELGYALFVRKGHQTELTAAGSYLFQRLVELRDGYEAAVSTGAISPRVARRRFGSGTMAPWRAFGSAARCPECPSP